MLIPQYKDMVLEVLALTFVVGAAAIGTVAGEDSSGVRTRPRSASLAPRPLRLAAGPAQNLDEGLGGAELADKPESSPDEQPPEDRSEVFAIIAYSVDSSPTESSETDLESPTIEVITIEPNGTCKIYTAWCDAEQVLMEINAQKERSHPSAPSPIP
jgi:hypothetical protein